MIEYEEAAFNILLDILPPLNGQKDRGYKWSCFVYEGILVLFAFV